MKVRLTHTDRSEAPFRHTNLGGFDALSTLGSWSLPACGAAVRALTATNHPELLGHAVCRRFQLRLELPPPNREAIAEWLRRFERRNELKLGLTAKQIDEHLTQLSYAELEEFCTDVLRRLVLQGAQRNTKSVVASRLSQLSARFRVRK